MDADTDDFSERPTVVDPAGLVRVYGDRAQQLMALGRRLTEQKAVMSESMYGDIPFRIEHRGPTVLGHHFLSRYERILRIESHITRRLGSCARKARH